MFVDVSGPVDVRRTMFWIFDVELSVFSVLVIEEVFSDFS